MVSILLAGLAATQAIAGEADVVAATATPEDGDTWRFDVTVRHADQGWDHYADAWEVRSPDGAVLGTRKLLHPHDAEQPFTRSLGGVTVPAGLEEVEIVAHDSVHGWGGASVRVQLVAP